MTVKQKREQLTALFGVYSQRIERLYDDFIMQLSHLAHKTHVSVKEMLTESPLFHFNDYPEIRQELNNIFADYVQSEMLAYRTGITDGVALAYTHDNSVLTGFSVLSDKAISHARNTAAETFLRTRLKTTDGLNLSQLVWNYCSQTRSEFEVAISNVIADGLKQGTSAADLGRMVRQYLNNPDMMYRRYHRTVVDAQGNKKDIVRWRRRIIDENGKVRFIEQPLEKVGMGHYRSSRKNSERLMRTEINSAYHHANYERWQKEPFVIGISIELSPQHPVYDECDELQGLYPKDFLFSGFHPSCMCSSNPVTIQGEEKEEFYRRLAAGEDMSNYVSPNRITDIPDKAKAWIDENKDKFIRAAERGKLGYVWRDNMKYVGRRFTNEELGKMGYTPDILHQKRIKTDAEKADIQRRWDERRKKNELIIKTGKNVWSVADNLGYIETLGMKAMLRNAIIESDTVAINQYSRALAKEIALLNKESKILNGTIPNAKEWLKQFTLSDLKEVEKVVNDNLVKWGDKYAADHYLKSKYNTLEDFLLSKLKSEAKYVVDETYLKPHTLYPTSKVAESAYLNQISLVQHKLDMKAISSDIAEIKKWSDAHTKSKKVANLLKEAQQLYNEDKDIALLKQKVSDAKIEIEKREKEQLRRDRKAGKTNSFDKLYTKGNPFNAEELAKLQEYEKNIIDGIFTNGTWDYSYIEEYYQYVLKLSEKYYDSQLSLYSKSENKQLQKVIKRYLSYPTANPRYIWNGSLGGVYDEGYMHKTESYLSKGILKGLSKEEISIVQRFTNGSTFSNCYNLYKESPYWRNRFRDKFKDYITTLKQAKQQFKYIEEWSQSANYVLDKMVRYNGITFRGINLGGGPELRNALTEAFTKKKPWINNASCSTSMKADVARRFDDDLIMVIHNKTGAYIHEVSEYSSEYEIMTLRGAKYRVLRPPVKIGSRYFCELEEII